MFAGREFCLIFAQNKIYNVCKNQRRKVPNRTERRFR